MTYASIGVVVIGRNEGERLRACLTSLRDAHARVYVDSGSTDDSCAMARALGFEVVELAIPPGFTAARARNTGIEWLTAHYPDLLYVQTVDGDCEVREGWLDHALRDMAEDPRRAAVFGRRRERFPDANAYHMVCDDEWNVPTGEVESCGGDALFRLAALKEAQGYNGALIAGEEPDMCLRMRQKGWRIWSNGQEMTWHDVAISQFGQWWQRSKRAGYAFAELVERHADRANPSWRRLLRSAQVWTLVMIAAALALPAIALSVAVPPRSGALTLLASLPVALLAVQLWRMMRQKRAAGLSWGQAMRWAVLIMAAKPAQAQGSLRYQLGKMTKAKSQIIEYKG